MLADFRLAAHRLTRAPGFAGVTVVTLALGLAATTAIFSLLDAVALRPFPYPGAERLAVLRHEVPSVSQAPAWGISKANYFYYQRSPAVERIAIYVASNQTLTGGDRPDQVHALVASPSVLELLGARAQLGRLLTEADVPLTGNVPHAVVLGDGAWRARFGADPSIVGRTVRLDGQPLTVVGVAAPLQRLPTLTDDVDAWVPMLLDPAAPAQNAHMRDALVRLHPGVSVADAEGQLRTLAGRLPAEFPNVYTPGFLRETGFRPMLTPLREAAVGPVVRVLRLVLGGVALVLLIAAANVANLMLARREARRRDLALQTALGAGRGRLVCDAVAEGAVLALAAAALALPAAALAVRVTRALAPAGLPLLDTARVDWRAALVCAGVALATAVGVGALPLMRARPDFGALREGGRGATAGRTRFGVRHALVVGQVALALVLLASAGLLVESVRRLHAVRPGFDVDHVFTASVLTSATAPKDDARRVAFWHALEARLAALPGVVAVGATERLPLAGGNGCSTITIDRAASHRDASGGCVATAQVTPGFFRALDIHLQGATSDWTATERGLGGVVVTDALAARLWPDRDPAGRGIRQCQRGCPQDLFYRVSGVAVGVRDKGVDLPPPEIVYFPVAPVAADSFPGAVPSGMTVVLRSAGTDPMRYAPALRRALAEVDPAAPLGPVRPMRVLLAQSLARRTFTMALLSSAAAMAVLLAAVGLYGTLAYVVGLRRREIGVRMALGARAAEVRGLVVRQSAGLAAAGVVVGLVGVLATTRLLRSLLFEVAPGDPRVIAAGVVLLAGVAALASYLPARRATRVDPIDALRAD